MLSIAGKDISLPYIFLTGGFLFLLFKQIKNKQYPEIFCLIKKDLVLKVFLIFLTFLLISVIYSVDKLDGLKICTMVSFGFMAYYLFSNVKLNIRKCVWGLVISTLPMAVLMIIISFSEPLKMKFLSLPFTRLFIEPNTLQEFLACPITNNIGSIYRQGGFFLNASLGGLYLGLNIAILFGLYVNEKKVWLKMTNLGLIIVFIGALVTTQSRGAIGAVLIAVLIATVLILFRNFRSWKRLLMLYIAFIFSLSLCMGFNPSGKISMQRLVKTYRNNTLHARKAIWRISWKVVKKHWFKGTGLSAKSWENKYSPEAKKLGIERAYLSCFPHNMYLYIWGQSGILTLVSFLILLCALFSNSIKAFLNHFFKSGESFFAISAFMATLILCLVGMTENFPLADPRISIIFGVVNGFVSNILKN